MKFNWKLIILLAAFALIRPMMSIMGVTEMIGQPYTSISLTLIISAVWIITMVYKNVKTPVQHLVMTGILYAAASVILSGVLSPVLLGALMGPLTNPFDLISVLMTNIIWGTVTGLISLGIIKIINQPG